MLRPFLSFILLSSLALASLALAQEQTPTDLEFYEEGDLEVLKEIEANPAVDIDLSEREEMDDLESLKADIEEVYFDKDAEDDQKISKDFLKEIEFETLEKKIEEGEAELGKSQKKNPSKSIDEKIEEFGDKKESKNEVLSKSGQEPQKQEVVVSDFDVGEEEAELLKLAENLGGKLTRDEWKEITKSASSTSYTVRLNDTLWSISKRFFGTGFYYSKVWALNPNIINPHQIEVGDVLTFLEGDEDNAPELLLGDFSSGDVTEEEKSAVSEKQFAVKDLNDFAENGVPDWLREREAFKSRGIYVQNASEYTYADLERISEQNKIVEYQNYEPPENVINIVVPETFDEVGFDKSSIVRKEFKKGFYLNTFITSNIVQDFGEIEASPEDNDALTYFKKIYIRFDAGLSISPGDLFSIYSAEGKVSHPVSERSGYRYTIKGSVRIVKKINDLWEAEVFDVQGPILRSDRVTVYTLKISSLLKTFNQRSVEAAIIGAYERSRTIYGYGDVVYLDRGRADGLELGNILEVYSFTDRNTRKKISTDPTYKIGELRIITLTENFSTALVSNSSYDIQDANIAVTKTQAQAIRENKIVNKDALKKVNMIEEKALEELDVELNLDSIGEALLEKADRLELTEDELDELERQEREKSFLKDYEEDLKELDRLEKEIEEAEGLLNEIIEDQDKLLEQQDLNKLEEELTRPDPDAFESLDEIEQEIGRKYLDEDLNEKENPYGLTEFDLEEIDELLNTDEELNPTN